MTGRLRKLATMSLAEIAWRLRHAAARRYAEASHARRGPVQARPRLAGGGPVPRSAPVLVPRGPEGEQVVDWLRSRPDYVHGTLRAADEIRRHRFVLLGHEVSYGRDVAWCADPRSGRPWPMVYHTKVPIFAGDTGAGDCKFVWELNRHQFLPTLAKAFRLSGDRAYAVAAMDLVRSWIDANPVQVGINWASGLELAVRSLAWAFTYALLDETDALDGEDRRLVLGALEDHGREIERHLSYYFSPYNHLVGELTALYVLGTAFPFLSRAGAWALRGWRDLARILPDQFHEDGGSVEQSTAYHHFTLGFYVQAYLVRLATGEPVPEPFVDRLTRAFEFSMYLTRPDGSLPMIGDADEGRSIEVGQAGLWDFRAHLAVGAALLGRGDMKHVAGALPEEAVWLLGCEAVRRYEALETDEPALPSRLLPGSGYAVMRASWGRSAHCLLFDAGPLAAGVSEGDAPSAAHGHADALSIEVASHGEAILVDPGFFTYNGDPAWHRYFRETAAHNTAVVDDRSQAEVRGRLTWSCAPRVQVDRWASGRLADLAEGSHTGYRRLAHPVTHRRAVLFVKPDYWVLRDEFAGEGTHRVDRYFHFAETVSLERSGAALRSRTAGGGGLAVIPLESRGLEVEVRHEGDGPDRGWVAAGYERRVRAPVARWRTTSVMPEVRHTLLLPLRAGAPEPVITSTGQGESGRVTTIDVGGGRREVIVVGRAGEAPVACGEWETDARLAWARIGPEGQVERCGLIDGTALLRAGAAMLRLDRRVGLAATEVTEREVIVEVSEHASVLAPARAATVQVSRYARRDDR